MPYMPECAVYRGNEHARQPARRHRAAGGYANRGEWRQEGIPERMHTVDDSTRYVARYNGGRFCVLRVYVCIYARIRDAGRCERRRVGRQLTHDVNPQQDFQFHGCFYRSLTCLTRAVCDPRSSSVVVASDASLRMSSERHLSARPLSLSLFLLFNSSSSSRSNSNNQYGARAKGSRKRTRTAATSPLHNTPRSGVVG